MLGTEVQELGVQVRSRTGTGMVRELVRRLGHVT